MKILTATLLLSAAIIPPVYAHSTLQPEGGMGYGQMGYGQMGNGHMGMPMMYGADNDEMRPHFEEMQKLMQEIQQEKDPNHYNQLMQQHLKLLQEGMHLMGNAWQNPPPPNSSQENGSPAVGADKPAAPANGQENQWQRSMEQRLYWMGTMMEQLMEREQAREQQTKPKGQP